MDNVNFERDQKNLFKKVEGGTKHVGKIPEMEKFVKFWADIWEKDDRTPEMPWMESVSRQLRDKIASVDEFNITVKTLEKETKKRKNWAVPGIDGIQNFWRKKLAPARTELKGAFKQVKDNNDLISVWWPSGRTMLLPKVKDLTDEKSYCPITCLNTSYKLLPGLVGKYMRKHTIENNIWDEGKLGAVVGLLGTVDQLIIDKSVMEKVKTHHRNLAAAFYD